MALNLGMVLRAERDPDGARSTVRGMPADRPPERRQRGMAGAILGLACLAGDPGDWHRAAVLHGAAQAFRDRTGHPWEEYDARNRRDSLDQARAHLGDEQLERAYAQGMALSLDKALDLALGRRARPDRYRRLTRDVMIGQAAADTQSRSRRRPPSMQIDHSVR